MLSVQERFKYRARELPRHKNVCVGPGNRRVTIALNSNVTKNTYTWAPHIHSAKDMSKNFTVLIAKKHVSHSMCFSSFIFCNVVSKKGCLLNMVSAILSSLCTVGILCIGQASSISRNGTSSLGMGANRTRIRELADSQPILLIRCNSQFARADLRAGESTFAKICYLLKNDKRFKTKKKICFSKFR